MGQSGRWPVVLSLIFAISILINIVSAYQITYRIQDDDSAQPVEGENPSVYWAENCDIEMTLRNTAGHSGSYTVTNYYYSPNDVEVGYAPLEFDNNISCRLINPEPIGGGPSLNGFYESSMDIYYSSNVFDAWLTSIYDCTFDSNELFIYNNTDFNDSYGNHPFGYGKKFGTCYGTAGNCPNNLTGDLNSVINYLETGYYVDCGSDLRVDRTGEQYAVSGCAGIPRDIYMNYWIMVPFNSMPSGRVNLSVFGRVGYRTNPPQGGTLAYDQQYYLWDTITNSTTNLGTVFPYTSSLTLQPDREYWLFVGTRYHMDNHDCGSGVVWGVGHNWTQYSISIWAYEPDWDCSAWSECEDQTQSRLCIDPLGQISDRVEQRSCEVGIIENATLGFEETESVLATICFPDWNVGSATWGIFTGVGCVYSPHNITVERPVGWTVSGDALTFNRYFMDFTSEWASEGTRSLKLWTIPPKENEWDGSLCTNRTISEFPIIENIFSNTSMRVNYNVTFPETNMRIRFDAKTCKDQIRQNYPLMAFNGTWIQVQVCPEYCYANTCNTTPTGNFYFDLYDNSINESVFGEPIFHESITTKRQPIDIDLTGISLEVGKNYTLSFAVFTDNPQDTRGNCIMLDDVRYDVLEESYLSILAGECKSKCVGNDYYQARILPNGGCLVKKIYFSEICMETELAESIERLEDVCLDSNTLLHYNSFMADYEELDCDYGCIDAHCITGEEYNLSQQAEALEQSLYDPPLILQSIITAFSGWEDYEDWEEAGYGTAWGLLSVFALYCIALLIMATVITGFISAKGDKVLYPVFLIILAGGLLAGVPLQTVPWEVGLTIATMIGLMLAYEFRKGTTG